MDFIDYTIKIYSDKLKQFEALDLLKLDRDDLGHYAMEASAMKKFMYDNLAEGYEYTFNKFVSEIDVINRLNSFLDVLFAKIGDNSSERSFYLCENAVNLTLPTPNGGMVFEMQEYLLRLSKITMNDVEMNKVRKYPEWIEKTERILDEMKRFVAWIKNQSAEGKFVCLLRDTLLAHLVLSRSGCESVPLIVGRKYLAQYDERFFDEHIMDILYDALSYDDIRATSVTEAFNARYHARKDDRITRMSGILRAYLDRHLHGSGYIAVESGIQGTMPLLLQAVDPRIAGFRMYTTFPWFAEVYEAIVFQRNYHFLREMETLVCHDTLFAFHEERDGNIYIIEQDDPTVRNLAYYEIARFMELTGGVGSASFR